MTAPTPSGSDVAATAAAAGQADFSTLFELLPIGAYRSSPEGRMLRANRALVASNGYADEAGLLASVGDIAREWYVLPARRAEFRAALLRDGSVRGFVSEVYRHRTRERIWVSENAFIVRDAAGGVAWYEGTVEDITERIDTQHTLEHRAAQVRLLMQQLPGMAYQVHIHRDGTTKFLFVSHGVRALYGVAPDAVLADGTLLRSFRAPEDPAALAVDPELLRRAATPAPVSTDFRIRLHDGTLKWVHLHSVAIWHDDDSAVRNGVVLDITAERAAAALRAERDRAGAADRAKSALLSRISHELRTPLNAVLGFAQLLEIQPELGERSRAWAGTISASGRHLLALVNDVLDLSALEGGEFRLQTQAVALAPLVDQAWSMVAIEADTLGIGWIPPAPPVPAVRADPQRLRQVLSNLLSNAVKYNRPQGHVQVRVAPVEGGRAVVIEVVDTGGGLSDAQRQRLFQPFDRLGAEYSGIGGTGLGLALTRQLVQAMDGRLDVDSTPGVGSCLRVTLPAAGAAAGPAAGAAAEAERSAR
ncbi:MAG: ATP-binding protein [Rubrivivax sp.]